MSFMGKHNSFLRQIFLNENSQFLSIVYFSSAILFCAAILGHYAGPELEYKRKPEVLKAV